MITVMRSEYGNMDSKIAMRMTMDLVLASQDPSHRFYDPRVYPDEISKPENLEQDGKKNHTKSIYDPEDDCMDRDGEEESNE